MEQKSYHIRPTRPAERDTPDDQFIAFEDGAAAGSMARTPHEAMAKLLRVKPPEPPKGEFFTEEQLQEVNRAWSSMPYGGSLGLNYDKTPKSLLHNLNKLSKRLKEVGENERQMQEELSEFRAMARGIGKFIRRAMDITKPEPVGGPR